MVAEDAGQAVAGHGPRPVTRRRTGVQRYQRILVAMKAADRGPRMFGYVGAIARQARTREVHILHVVDSEASPSGPDVTPPEVEAFRASAAEHFRGHGGENIICKVVTGSPLLETLRYARDKDIDLIILGKRLEAEDEAVLARRVTRKATCSVLVLPDGASTDTRRIVVPARRSDCSARALGIATEIAAAYGAEVICLNVFQVHSGYSRVGMTLEEHEAALRAAAEQECASLLQRVRPGAVRVSPLCLPDLYNRPGPIILETVQNESADLIVIGARGRSGAAGVLLGKITEELIQQSPVPLLAVKKKGECLGIVEALLTIADPEQ
jgi:nucleotide-binding universal stress UspA family protein